MGLLHILLTLIYFQVLQNVIDIFKVALLQQNISILQYIFIMIADCFLDFRNR